MGAVGSGWVGMHTKGIFSHYFVHGERSARGMLPRDWPRCPFLVGPVPGVSQLARVRGGQHSARMQAAGGCHARNWRMLLCAGAGGSWTGLLRVPGFRVGYSDVHIWV